MWKKADKNLAGASGVKEDVWLGGTAQSTSPSSPFTIESQTDSQAGGDYYPPASESNPSDSPSTDQYQRGFPNLNISLPPTGLQLGPGVSPASLVGSDAVFTTDSLPMHVDPAEDYFRFADATLLQSAQGDVADVIHASVSLPQTTRPTPSPLGGGPSGPLNGGMVPAQSTQYRHPASQPSSPVRGVFASGQQQFNLSPAAGRQRSTTVSGISPFEPFGTMPGFGAPPLQLPAQMAAVGPLSAPVTAVPQHLAFTAIHSPVPTSFGSAPSAVQSVAPSPVTELPPSAFLCGEANNTAAAQTGTAGDVTMEDATNPSSRRSSGGSAQSITGLTGQGGAVASAVTSMSGSAPSTGVAPQLSTNDIAERLTMEKLTMLDKIVSEAQSAKAALLSGQADQLPAALNKISSQLDKAGELGIARTPRETTPNSGSNKSISPVHYSPSAQSSLTATPQQPLGAPPAMSGQSLLPSLPVGQLGITSAATTTGVSGNSSATVPSAASALSSPVTSNHMRPATTSVTDFVVGVVPQAPPPVHSYPNGHQMPGQVHHPSAATPTTPVNATFNQPAMGVHMPNVPSPLATLSASRPASPRMHPQQWMPDNNVAAASSAMAAATGHNMAEAQQQMLQAQAVQQMQAAMMHSQLVQHQQMQQQQQQLQQQAPQPDAPKLRRSSVIEQRVDGRPIVRARSTSSAKQGQQLSMSSSTSVPPSAWQSRAGSPADDDDDDDEEDDDEDAAQRRPKRRRSSVGPDVSEVGPTSGVHISDDVRSQLDTIFLEFLSKVCSNLDAVDNKGEKLHQVLMPKKMQRLDESTDYRPFKFRIQAFTNAFHEELIGRGITEETMSIKKVKVYLWHQDLISRFNADGKKAKSKGNHIWHIDAKKLPGGGWIFRPFKRKIIGTPPTFAVINQRYEWEPKIWDPMAPSSSIKPTFSSPPGTLPHWLRWEDGKLTGVPDTPHPGVNVHVKADFIDGAHRAATATMDFTIQVVTMAMPMAPDDPVFANPVMQPWVPAEHALAIAPPMPMMQGPIPYGSVPMYHQPQPGFGP
ncbi:hypothetical protein CspeluHIS016_0502880 [Cutaneotrichosporon spelunceum]|uniref:Uncharacterized protein n=1 Tax=Cutaneotrichosporon spelunceum TaxID=1672016 RepID=A0AAD3TWP5_9TREE|nr:hypothetical protein CspeluHIS016_0502880 [Cutaneotrichosporon spelunceum]